MTEELASPRRITRRGALLGAAGSALLAGCAGGMPTAAPAGKGFPVTVNGKLGNTTIPAPPQRVVACGYLRDTDLALALGAHLVGTVKNAVFPTGIAPWQRIDANTRLLTAVNGQLPIEDIAALHPDLILASDDYSLPKHNGTLTKLAPTLGYLNGVGKDSWKDMATRTGKALGATAKAATLVQQIQDKINGVRARYPGFAGKTFTFGPVTPAGQIYTTSSEKDAAATFFSQLGMRLSPRVTTLPVSATAGKSVISSELLDVLDADVVILSFGSNEDRAKLEANPLFQRLPAVKRGSYVPLDIPTAVSLAFPSVLSIPFGLNIMAPKLAAALHI